MSLNVSPVVIDDSGLKSAAESLSFMATSLSAASVLMSMPVPMSSSAADALFLPTVVTTPLLQTASAAASASCAAMDDTESEEDDDGGVCHDHHDDEDDEDDDDDSSSDEDDEGGVGGHDNNNKYNSVGGHDNNNTNDSSSDSDSDDSLGSITPTMPSKIVVGIVVKRVIPVVVARTDHVNMSAFPTGAATPALPVGAATLALPVGAATPILSAGAATPTLSAITATPALSAGAATLVKSVPAARKNRVANNARNIIMSNVLCIDNTSQKKRKMQEDATDFDEVTFAGLMCPGKEKNIIFHEEIRQRAKMAGMDRMSDEVLEKYVFKFFGLKAFEPSKDVNGKHKQARGYKNLRFTSLFKKDHVHSSRIVTRDGPVPPSKLSQVQASPALKVVKLVHAVPSEKDDQSRAPSSVVAGVHMPLLAAGIQSKNDGMSLWQTGVMTLIHESLAKTTSSMPSMDSSGNIGVGLVLSKDRRGIIVVSRIIAGPSAVLSSEFVEVGDRVVNIDGYMINDEFSLEHVCGRIMGKPGSTVHIKMRCVNNPRDKEIVFLRNPLSVQMPTTPTPNKIFVYGGLQEDRDKCIGRLQRDYGAYCILPMQSSTLKIADMYSKCDVRKPLVVIEYEEGRCTFNDWGKETKIKNAKIQKANAKVQKNAQAVARCLTMGRFWHDIRGPVSFDPPENMFVFCNEQPCDRGEWEGWTFYHISDKTA